MYDVTLSEYNLLVICGLLWYNGINRIDKLPDISEFRGEIK